MTEPAIRIAGTEHDTGHAWKPENVVDYERLKEYRDKSIAWVIPSRGMYPALVVDSWDAIQWPMNQPRTPRVAALRMEVGDAYNYLFKLCTDYGFASIKLGNDYARMLDRMKFILTTEEDNIIPPTAINDLFAAIYTCIDCGKDIQTASWTCPDGHKGLDAVGGLYWTKCIPSRPMAYGDPKDGDDFRPISVSDAIAEGRVLEVNGLAMGCTLFRKASLNGLSQPWFKTSTGTTQDLYLCSKMKKELGARFGVHCGVRVGHLDIDTGERF